MSKEHLTVKEIREMIEASGDTMLQAAERLGMTKQNLYAHLKKEPLSSHFIRQVKEIYQRSSKMDIVAEEGIPYYPLDATASNVEVFNDHPEIASLKIQIPGFEDCQLAMPVYGHSMYPTYDSGCIILCKQITDLDVINYGEAHLVITKEQRLLKRIRKSNEPNHVLLESDNYEAKDKEGRRRYEAFDLNKSKIVRLYIVKGSIKRNQI